MGKHATTYNSLTARSQSRINCPTCRLLCWQPKADSHAAAVCPRCGAHLHLRKPASITRTWALVIAALIFYLPANLLPIMVTSSFGRVASDTIISGVFYFMHTGSWHLALIIFAASIVVPLIKLLVLIYLLLSVQLAWLWRPRERTRLYRMIESIGRWSMVDIFAVTTMVALVKMQALGNVDAGPAAPFFAAVVVLTMMATACFDPRMIWDVAQEA